MSADVSHPLVAPLPRLTAPAARLVRWALVTRLSAGWAGGRLDLALPSGEIVRIGEAGPPEATARVHDDRMFLRLFLRGEMGGGESFVAGEWSSADLVGLCRVFLRGTVARGAESWLTRVAQLPELARHRRSTNTEAGSERNIHAHYDLGNAFYALFLDADTMAYSCAYWPHARMTLADAQRAKLEQLCDALALSPRDHLLELGCGWGSMAIHAAKTRGCKVTAITVSREQHRFASERVAAAGLSDRISIQFRDYRDLAASHRTQPFDKLVSIEMLEAVGADYLPAFFAACAQLLAPAGRLALQSITMPDDRFDAYRTRVDWMQTYVFPGSCIPSLAAIRRAAQAAGLAIASAEDIGPHYAPTLRAWRMKFLAQLPRVRALGFDEPFIRTWLMYLAFSEAAFTERTLGDHQLVLTSRA